LPCLTGPAPGFLRTAGDKNGPLSFLDFAIKSLRADGDHTVVATLSQLWAPSLSDISVFANGVLPKDFGGQSESAFFANPIGTGPFRLKSLVKGGNVSLERNPHYWQAGKPYLDAVNSIYVNDDYQRVLQLKGGQVHVISAVPATQVAALRADPSIVLEAFGAWAVDLLFFNEKVPQLADRHVRRAIDHALDITAVAKATTYGTAPPGNSSTTTRRRSRWCTRRRPSSTTPSAPPCTPRSRRSSPRTPRTSRSITRRRGMRRSLQAPRGPMSPFLQDRGRALTRRGCAR
jgi:ABC-type transport system substrate-binding protein